MPRAEALRAAADEPDVAVDAELRRDGPIWIVLYDSVPARVPHSKGVEDLAVLLASPGREMHAADLAGTIRMTDTGEVLDQRARQEYRARIAELDEDIAEAEAAGDAGRLEVAQQERDAIVEQLTRALGLGGRARRSGDAGERARKAVTWRVRRAIRAIAEQHAALGQHLDESIKTGTYCSYEPPTPVRWHIGSS